MKIWVIGRDLPSKENNMNGSFEFEQAQMLVRAGHEVIYPVVDIRSIRRWRRWGYVQNVRDGVCTAVLNIPIGKLLPGSLRGKVREKWIQRKLFEKIVKRHGVPDIIHVHYPAIWPYSFFEWLQQKGAKIVGTEHWTAVQEKTLSGINFEYLREFSEKSDALLCVGTPLKNSIIDLTGTRREIQVIPNIVSDLFSYDKSFVANIPPFRFVAAGRLVEHKRFDLLIDAFVQAFKGNTDVVLDIIGGGDQYQLLQQKIDEYNCGDQIHLVGLMNREEIAQFYKKCHALVLSSNLETFGVPVIEAFASGMPVVTTDAIGFLEYTHSGNAIVVEANNTEQFAGAMLNLWRNYESFNREEIFDSARSWFGEKAIAARLNNIFSKLFE